MILFDELIDKIMIMNEICYVHTLVMVTIMIAMNEL